MPLDALGARRFYDRIGRLQDTQRFYEAPAVRRLLEVGQFNRSEAVFELGCGTGRLGEELLTNILPAASTYFGVDVSPAMVRLASHLLSPWSARATVQLLDPPAVKLPQKDGAFDRFLATYVFDLLSFDDAALLIGEAARLLRPGGLLALVSLTPGTTPLSRLVCNLWNAAATRWPSAVGGCRPIELRELVAGEEWEITSTEVVISFGVASEVLIAERLDSASN